MPGPHRGTTGWPRRAGSPEPPAPWSLLKGPLTAVAGSAGATPDVLLAAAGGPALATAGSGDVLSGIIAAFCARGLGPLEAAALAAHVHGRAASLGPSQGLVAGDLPGLVARVLSAMDPARQDRDAGDR